MNAREKEKQEAIESLREIKPGETIHTIFRHVSQSGMYRAIDLYVMRDNAPVRITWNACKATGFRYDKNHEAMGISGCGTDVGFEAVYNLSWALFKDGFDCVGEGCPSNDHSNGDTDYSPHRHTDQGYALKHKWL